MNVHDYQDYKTFEGIKYANQGYVKHLCIINRFTISELACHVRFLLLVTEAEGRTDTGTFLSSSSNCLMQQLDV